LAVWVGVGLVAAVVVGPTGAKPGDLTGAARHDGGVAAVLIAAWLLLFIPVARQLTRPEATAYLRSLPGPTVVARLLLGGAVLVLQLPWLVLWVLGEGLAGAVVVAGTGAIAIVLGQLRPPPARASWRSWGSGGRALRAAYRRALRRRAGDALVRAAGLALLGGLAAGALIRNNALDGPAGATLGAAAILVVTAPGLAGVLLPLLDAHRATSWLCASTGISAATRLIALALATAAVFVASALVAVVGAVVLGGLPLATAAWLAGAGVVAHAATALVATRALLWAAGSAATAARAVLGVIAATAIAVLLLGLLGLAGVVGVVAVAALALATVRAEELT
jgi:hypothetical protein